MNLILNTFHKQLYSEACIPKSLDVHMAPTGRVCQLQEFTLYLLNISSFPYYTLLLLLGKQKIMKC